MTLHAQDGKLILPGDFAAVHNTTPVGRLIHFAELLDAGFQDYEHALTYVGGPEDLILEAEPHGAKLIPFRQASIAGYDCLWSTTNDKLDLTPQQRAMVPGICIPMKGIGYSALDYFAIAGHHLHVPDLPVWPGGTSHPHRLVRLSTFIDDSGHQMCSQLVDRVRLLLGFHLFTDNRWPGYVTPSDIGGVILG